MASGWDWRRAADEKRPIGLWESVGVVYAGVAAAQPETPTLTIDREMWAAGHEPPLSLDDYLVEHGRRPEPETIDELTVRQALAALGLPGRAHLYPIWVCAEAWLFMALRIGRRVAAGELLARAHDLGIPATAIQQAKVRLGVVSTRQGGVRHGGWRWQLPPAIAERGAPGDIDPRWRRWSALTQLY